MNHIRLKRWCYWLLRRVLYIFLLGGALAYVFSGVAQPMSRADVPILMMRGVIAMCGLVTAYQVISTLKYLGPRRTAKGIRLNVRMIFRSFGPILLLSMCVFVLAGSPFLLRIPNALAPFHVLVPVAAATCCIIWLFLPPIALVLGASDESLGGLTLANVVSMFRPLKAVSLLRPERMPDHTDTGLFWWRYRTLSGEQWEEQVRGLLRIVAFVFTDVRYVSAHVERELALMKEEKPSGTLLIIVDEDDVSPIIKTFIRDIPSMGEVTRVLGGTDADGVQFHLAVPACVQSVTKEWLLKEVPDRPKVYAPNEAVARTLAEVLR